MRYEINLCKHVTLCAHPQKCIRSHQQKKLSSRDSNSSKSLLTALVLYTVGIEAKFLNMNSFGWAIQAALFIGNKSYIKILYCPFLPKIFFSFLNLFGIQNRLPLIFWKLSQNPKYSKHWPDNVAHTTDCVCSKMLNHGINHGLLLSPFKFLGQKYNLYWIKSW